MKNKFGRTMPDIIEKEILAEYPTLDEWISDFLNESELRWPEWCYLPMTASYGLIVNGADQPFAYRIMANGGINNLRFMSAIIPWRVGKPVYRFDKELAEELMNNTTAGKIPVEIILHMPYPCLYIENPPCVEHCVGMFVFLEWDERYPNAVELRMHYVFDDETIEAVYLQYDVNGVDTNIFEAKVMLDSVQALFDMMRYSGRIDIDELSIKRQEQLLEQAPRHMNLILYLCSQEPDIRRRDPIPRLRGVRKDVAAYSDKIDVGTYIGATIRKAAALSKEQTHSAVSDDREYRSPRPHMRKAHWHLYWTGQGRTVARMKWVMPIFVKGSVQDTQDKPTVIHPVK